MRSVPPGTLQGALALAIALGLAVAPATASAASAGRAAVARGLPAPPGSGVLLPSEPSAPPEPALCFGPDVPVEEVERVERQRIGRAARAAREAAREAEASGLASAQYRVSAYWSSTATDGFGMDFGDPLTITWSIVPDGTAMPGSNGEPSSPSDLRAFLNENFGPESFWFPLISSVFERWGELTGVTYVYSPDDGAAFPSSPGLLGVRGDVRLAGHMINGTGGVIGYNWYPTIGDMVLDTADANFGWGTTLLKNVIAHEHGHGIGLDHVCPRDGTKLMEPVATVDFEGPQHDDIRAGNRAYGDDFEPSDIPVHATDLGAIGDAPLVLDGASIHRAGDVDLVRVTVAAGRTLSATVTPVGEVYLEGPQLNTGACSAGTGIDSRAAADLSVEVLAADASTVLASGNVKPAGEAESATAVDLPGAGTYYVRVTGNAADAVQLYDLSLSSAPAPTLPDEIFADDFESGDLEAWAGAPERDPDLAVVPSAAMGGTDLGLRIELNDRARLIDRSPRRESRYRARFWIDAGGYAPLSSSDRLTVLQLESAKPTLEKLVLLAVRLRAGVHQIQARVRRDDGTYAESRFVDLPAEPAAVEIEWRQASAPGANDGLFRLWIDANEGAPPSRRITGIDNDQRGIDTVRIGAITVPPGATGQLAIDRFESRRASFIGP